jgi:hypothetical protein
MRCIPVEVLLGGSSAGLLRKSLTLNIPILLRYERELVSGDDVDLVVP